MSFFDELKRRNVFRVGIAYAVAAWLLMQLTDVLVQLLELPTFIGKAVVVFLTIGFPLALIFAWAFELTPEGIKREKEVDRSQSQTHQTGKKLDRAIITVLAVVVVWLLVDKFYLGPRAQTAAPSSTVTTEPATKSIAVLPFADLSEGQDQAWFADGLAEEILNALARTPDLLVSSRTATFAYKGKQVPLTQIASELGVEHVLEGSVRRAGDRIRVTAQLIRAEDGFHVWSENYDRDTADVIELQEDLALAIAKALKTTMDPEALKDMLAVGTRSVAAYEHYLNGLSLTSNANTSAEFEDVERAYEEFEQAQAIDPEFAAAHAMAALYWRDKLSVSQRNAPGNTSTLAQRRSAFDERIQAAIRTAPNELDRQKYEVIEAAVDMRIRDAVRLGAAVFEQRPYDMENFNQLTISAVWASDPALMDRLMSHALSLADRSDFWANEYVEMSWRIGGPPADPTAYVDTIMRLIQRHQGAAIAYQAHRALLWMGEVDKARSLLPRLADDTEGGILVQARQACAEGRRADAEALTEQIRRDGSRSALDKATYLWHLLNMLGQQQAATEAMLPYDDPAAPIATGNYLVYPDFDPTPFPVVMNILTRERIVRPPPVPLPFACPDMDHAGRASVAVLPFVAMSSGEDDGYFADGLTEEILNSLTALPELLVTARTSSFHFKGRDLPVPDIARQLGVDHVVEGSVRRAGDRARITAQLIRAEDGFHLWSQTYDRTLEDVFAVQEDIAASIARTLDVVLDAGKREQMRQAGIGDVDAFIAFQKAQQAFYEAHGNLDSITEGLDAATSLFDHALAAAPDLIAARILKADATGHVVFDIASGRQRGATADEGNAALESLREEYDMAWQYARPGNQRDILDVERSLFADDWSGLRDKLVLALRPGDCPQFNWSTELALAMGFQQAVMSKTRERLRCDPYQPLANFMLAYTLIWSGDPQAALDASRDSLARGVEFLWLRETESYARLALGEFDDPRLVQPNPNSWVTFPREILVLAARGDAASARPIAEAFWNDPETDDWEALMPAAILGDRERANASAARIDARPGGMLVLSNITYVCACGAPFELDATPDFRRRIEQAGFDWPPPSPIQWPLKDWP